MNTLFIMFCAKHKLWAEKGANLGISRKYIVPSIHFALINVECTML